MIVPKEFSNILRDIFGIPRFLVFRVRHLLPISPDLVERVECAAFSGDDVLGGFAPDEGLRLGVVLEQVKADVFSSHPPIMPRCSGLGNLMSGGEH